MFNGASGGSSFNTELRSQANGGPRTDYFRTRFNWAGLTTGVVMGGVLRVDDGVIIYINGIELYRFNMGDPAAINYTLGTLDCNLNPSDVGGCQSWRRARDLKHRVPGP